MIPTNRRLAVLVLAIAGVVTTAVAVRGQHVQSAEGAHRLHDDPARYIAALDDPKREAWQKPREVISTLGLTPGMVIADIGAGSGYFALRFAHHVDPGGRVFAVDVSPDMVRHLDAAIRDSGLQNVSTLLVPTDDPKLPAGQVDLVFICDTWHHIEERPAYLRKIRAALKPGGRLVVIDFQQRDLPVGPPTSQKLSREQVLAELQGSGFTLAREHTLLPYQYFLEFTP